MRILLQLSAFLTELLILGVLVGALVALLRSAHRLPPRTVRFARAGLVLLMVQTVLAVLSPFLISFTVRGSVDTFILVNTAGGLVLTMLFGAGIVLVVAALLARRDEAPAAPVGGVWSDRWSVPEQPAPGFADIPVPDGPVGPVER